jgi:hypothetical protein
LAANKRGEAESTFPIMKANKCVSWLYEQIMNEQKWTKKKAPKTAKLPVK